MEERVPPEPDFDDDDSGEDEDEDDDKPIIVDDTGLVEQQEAITEAEDRPV